MSKGPCSTVPVSQGLCDAQGPLSPLSGRGTGGVWASKTACWVKVLAKCSSECDPTVEGSQPWKLRAVILL